MMKKSGMIIGRIGLLLILFLTLFPFYLLVVNSVKWNKEVILSPWGLASEWHFENYIKSFEQVLRPMLNTMFVTVCVVILVLAVSILAAYSFVRFEFKGSGICYLLIMAMLMIPGFVLLIPQFIQINRLGMFNTFAGLIFPPAAALSATGTFLLKSSMEGISKSLFEAADMEGARELHILRHIVLPLSKPTIATVVIVTGLATWNNYLWPLVSTTGEKTMQITVALTKLVRSATEGDGVLFSGYVIASVPLIILFSIASKSFVLGLTQGAVKG